MGFMCLGYVSLVRKYTFSRYLQVELLCCSHYQTTKSDFWSAIYSNGVEKKERIDK